MTLNLSNLSPAKGSTKSRKRVGRGGKRGTYSGKGMKGQKARSGVSGLKALGLRQTLLRTPKLRGFQSHKEKMPTVSVEKLGTRFADGDMVNARSLKKAGLMDPKETAVKIIGNSKLDKKLNVIANAYSAGAKKAIEDAGGKAEVTK